MKSIFKKSIVLAAFLFGAVSISNAQVKVGSSPTVIGTNSNLEVEATNGNKTIVNKTTGQVTIQDGTQGNGKVLTSDANGNSSWKSLDEAKVPTMTFVGTINTVATLGTSTAGSAVSSRLPLNPAPGYTAGWNVANRAYIVPVSGFYRAEMTATFSTSSDNGYVILALKGKQGLTDNQTFNVNNYGARTLVETAYYNAGDSIFGHIWATETGLGFVYKANFTITYIP